MPSLENLSKIFQDEQFAVITIDVQEERDVVEDFINKEGYSFEVYLDRDGKVASRYSIRAHPKSYLINPIGRVIGFAEGYRKWDSEAVIALVKSLINLKG